MSDACVICGYPTVPGGEARRCLECITSAERTSITVRHGDGHERRIIFERGEDGTRMETQTLTRGGTWRTVGSERIESVEIK